ncbi:Uncharacterised protein [Bordetella pertussis]|nr:Uncharacterised protein [Bordetella pertussis]CPM39924.1 Uncharacterised protein [Bordetella pertussis]
MPLTTPAAQNGIQAICTAQTVRPTAPNRARSMASMVSTPARLCLE